MGWITQETRRTDDGTREIALESKAMGAGEYRIRVDDLQLATFSGNRPYADAVFEGAATMLEGWLETIAEKNREIDGLRKSRDAQARAKSQYIEQWNDRGEQLEAVKERAAGAEAALEELRDYHDAAVERTHEFAGQLHAIRHRAGKADQLVATYRAALIRTRDNLAAELERVEELAGVEMENYTGAELPRRIRGELASIDEILEPAELETATGMKSSLEYMKRATSTGKDVERVEVDAPDPSTIKVGGPRRLDKAAFDADELARAGAVIRENDGAIPTFEPTPCQECGELVGLGDSAAFGASLVDVWCKACFMLGHYDEAVRRRKAGGDRQLVTQSYCEDCDAETDHYWRVDDHAFECEGCFTLVAMPREEGKPIEGGDK